MLKGKAILAYTAGIVDGEGSISLTTGKRKTFKKGYAIYLKVTVANTNEWLINWLKMQFGGYISCRSNMSNPKWKVAWAWEIQQASALSFLELILPYLNLKKPQAELAIKFQRAKYRGGPARSEKALALEEVQRILMRGLNKKGASL